MNYRASGEVDAMRIPKDGFFAHQVMWDGWVDVEKPRIHIIGHWNYKVGVRKSVHVVSGADEIELFLNGRSLGRNRNPEYRFLFSFSNIAWEPGVIEAVGYDSKGKESCRSKHETSGEPKALRLKSWTAPDGYGFKADGADHALVQVEVVDEEGRRVPTALNPIDFKIDGPAEWRGGIAMGPGNHILSKNLPVEGGVNRALLRARTSPGKVLISAASPGLAAATLELRAVSPPEGLPGSGLKPTLLRGPTPSTASFKTSRISVPVASTRSGSRNDTAKFACDDNEETTWSNEPGKDSAWIEFTLARQADLSEITAKLSGWRSRSYPLSISIDGREVFRGTTPTSLGYVTLKLLPSKGRVVRVQLVGKSESKDGFGTIKEVSNQSNAADGPSVGSGELGIVEIEFHEPSPTDVKN